MPAIAIFYGTTSGNTELAAEKIAQQLGEIATMKNVADVELDDFSRHDVLLLGVPTWNIGQMQDDWAELLPRMKGLTLAGKKVGLFGMGDAHGYSCNFLDAMGQLWAVVRTLGAPQLVGVWPVEGYDFDESEAMYDDDHFVGLGLDDDNEPELHDERIEAWTRQILDECGLSV